MTDLTTRQALEHRVVRKLVSDLIAAGFCITLNDGEFFPIKKSADLEAILAEMFAVDEEWLLIRRRAEDGSFEKHGHVYLVYGNAGWEVICDYTVKLEPHLVGANALADQLSETNFDHLPALRTAHQAFIERLKASGKPVTKYHTPCCGSEVETEASGDETWDTLSTCPFCGGLHFKVTRGSLVEATDIETGANRG